ncbi:MAG: arsenosugar biosynthesis radical SAM protein ArsS [Vicingaceae bacterium]
MAQTLKHLNATLASPSYQNDVLNNGLFTGGKLPRFKEMLKKSGFQQLKPTDLEIFQINLGYMCNQTCKHCHVDAGPERKEIMEREVMDLCVSKIREFGVPTVDLTGGAPEMNPNFRYFISELRKAGVKEIIVRSNLTIFLASASYQDLPEFFRENRLRVVSSLPYFSASKTDRQRGNGVFDKSIKALRMLNEVGYGDDLILDLVYNPGGAFLPGDQKELERTFKRVLKDNHDITFNQLFALTNLPINRFLDYLIASGNYEDYMEKLVESFNPAAVDGLMCRNTISVDYTGKVYDCDFNQMLQLGVVTSSGMNLADISLQALKQRAIVTGQHCYGCTAGAGSSCQGSTVSQ